MARKCRPKRELTFSPVPSLPGSALPFLFLPWQAREALQKNCIARLRVAYGETLSAVEPCCGRSSRMVTPRRVTLPCDDVAKQQAPVCRPPRRRVADRREPSRSRVHWLSQRGVTRQDRLQERCRRAATQLFCRVAVTSALRRRVEVHPIACGLPVTKLSKHLRRDVANVA